MKKKLLVIPMVLAFVASMFTFQLGSIDAEAAGKTGVGLAEHALNCYYSGWQYEYGYQGQTVNGVTLSDCSGMIWAYTRHNASRSSAGQINQSSQSGSISTLPRIHGLGLWMSGHVGVYVGGGMAVDCRSDAYNMVYQAVTKHRWVKWYKVPGVSYPTTGWVTFQGEKYYYENGQYLANTTKTIDGVSYTFGWNGKITSSGGAPVDNKPDNSGENSSSSKEPVSSSAPVKNGSAGTSSKPSSGKTNNNSNSTNQNTSKAPVNTEPVYTSLGLNAEGYAVRNLQERLSELGYYYDLVNNYYDAFVRDAVMAYQKAAGLEATGTADVKTQKSIFSSKAPKNTEEGTLYPGLHTYLVRNMQERLVSLGYLSPDIELSSHYGDATKEAVLAYQAESGLKEDGIMNAEALEVLYSDKAVPAPVEEEEEEKPQESEPESEPDKSEKVLGKNTDASSKSPVSSQANGSEAPKDAAKSEMTIFEAMMPTVYAAEIAETVNVPEQDSFNSIFMFVLVVFCAGLTACIFFIQKKGGTRMVFVVLKSKVISLIKRS